MRPRRSAAGRRSRPAHHGAPSCVRAGAHRRGHARRRVTIPADAPPSMTGRPSRPTAGSRSSAARSDGLGRHDRAVVGGEIMRSSARVVGPSRRGARGGAGARRSSPAEPVAADDGQRHRRTRRRGPGRRTCRGSARRRRPPTSRSITSPTRGPRAAHRGPRRARPRGRRDEEPAAQREHQPVDRSTPGSTADATLASGDAAARATGRPRREVQAARRVAGPRPADAADQRPPSSGNAGSRLSRPRTRFRPPTTNATCGDARERAAGASPPPRRARSSATPMPRLASGPAERDRDLVARRSCIEVGRGAASRGSRRRPHSGGAPRRRATSAWASSWATPTAGTRRR